MSWGSALILKWVDRFPMFIYVGAGVLAWTAAQIMLHEPLLQPLGKGRMLIQGCVYAGIVGTVLLVGFMARRRRRRND
jgi:predicted tellurium resistance membrane protein TerC